MCSHCLHRRRIERGVFTCLALSHSAGLRLSLFSETQVSSRQAPDTSKWRGTVRIIISCYHNTKHAFVLQTPNMLYSVTRFAGSNTWLLGSGRWVPALHCLGLLHHKCCAHHPTWVKSTICQLASTSSYCKKGIDAIRSKWHQKLQSDSEPSLKLLFQDLTNTPVPTIYT